MTKEDEFRNISEDPLINDKFIIGILNKLSYEEAIFVKDIIAILAEEEYSDYSDFDPQDYYFIKEQRKFSFYKIFLQLKDRGLYNYNS